MAILCPPPSSRLLASLPIIISLSFFASLDEPKAIVSFAVAFASLPNAIERCPAASVFLPKAIVYLFVDFEFVPKAIVSSWFALEFLPTATAFVPLADEVSPKATLVALPVPASLMAPTVFTITGLTAIAMAAELITIAFALLRPTRFASSDTTT